MQVQGEVVGLQLLVVDAVQRPGLHCFHSDEKAAAARIGLQVGNAHGQRAVGVEGLQFFHEGRHAEIHRVVGVFHLHFKCPLQGKLPVFLFADVELAAPRLCQRVYAGGRFGLYLYADVFPAHRVAAADGVAQLGHAGLRAAVGIEVPARRLARQRKAASVALALGEVVGFQGRRFVKAAGRHGFKLPEIGGHLLRHAGQFHHVLKAHPFHQGLAAAVDISQGPDAFKIAAYLLRRRQRGKQALAPVRSIEIGKEDGLPIRTRKCARFGSAHPESGLEPQRQGAAEIQRAFRLDAGVFFSRGNVFDHHALELAQVVCPAYVIRVFAVKLPQLHHGLRGAAVAGI